MPELPFRYVSPDITQIFVIVLVQALVAYFANILGYHISPIYFYLVPIILAILLWKSTSWTILKEYLGFNTKNIPQKIIAGIAGAALGLSLYFILKYANISILAISLQKHYIFTSLPIILLFTSIIFILSFIGEHKIDIKLLLLMLAILYLPFMLSRIGELSILALIVGYGEEILSLLFAIIAINYLVSRGMKYNSILTHLLAWTIARTSWVILHALAGYGTTLQYYIDAFILGMIFTFIGYMFWFTPLSIAVMLPISLYDIYLYFIHSNILCLMAGSTLLLISLLLFVEKDLLKDNSLAFKEYVIYGPAMAHALYDLAIWLNL